MKNKKQTRKILTIAILITVLTLVATGAFFLADFIITNENAQQAVITLGYPGITFLALIAGLNILFPIPAALFVPVFINVGLWMPGIILALTIGTLLADFLGHAFGKISKNTINDSYPRLVNWLTGLKLKHESLLIPAIFFYAAFVPIPNEAIVIPAAIMGIRWRIMFMPLFFGNLVNQTTYALGFDSLYRYFF